MGDFACLAVSDTGCGMDAPTLAHMFEPFFTTTEVGKGTGLGLATVHGIVKQHQGWVEVESALNEGTVFRVYLPCCRAQEPRYEGRSSTRGPMAGGGETILLVEDEAVIALAEEMALTRLGYNVETAISGETAVEMVKSRPEIDLVLMDVDLGRGTDGTEAAELILKIRMKLAEMHTNGHRPELMYLWYLLTTVMPVIRRSILKHWLKSEGKKQEEQEKLSE